MVGRVERETENPINATFDRVLKGVGKMPKIECVEDVIMKSDEKVAGKSAFTKGHIYNMYSYNQFVDLNTSRQVFCAKNNWKERHIIKYKNSDELDEFFYQHFKVLL